jgi:hypothetical protein
MSRRKGVTSSKLGLETNECPIGVTPFFNPWKGLMGSESKALAHSVKAL